MVCLVVLGVLIGLVLIVVMVGGIVLLVGLIVVVILFVVIVGVGWVVDGVEVDVVIISGGGGVFFLISKLLIWLMVGCSDGVLVFLVVMNVLMDLRWLCNVLIRFVFCGGRED